MSPSEYLRSKMEQMKPGDIIDEYTFFSPENGTILRSMQYGTPVPEGGSTVYMRATCPELRANIQSTIEDGTDALVKFNIIKEATK